MYEFSKKFFFFPLIASHKKLLDFKMTAVDRRRGQAIQITGNWEFVEETSSEK